MDRAISRTARNDETGSADSSNPTLLPSRDAAHDALIAALDAEPGLFVLTGDAGVGKTWLRRRIAAERAYPWVWIEIDALPGDSSEAFHRKIGRGLGIEPGGRERWLDHLADRRRDQERHVLVIEEAHNLTPDLLEEVRATAALECFALILLSGQTSLARRLSSPAHRPFVSRVTGAVHIPPIDADEAQILLDESFPTRGFSTEEVEELHRDAWGEPRRLLRIAKARESSFRKVIAELSDARPRPRPEPAASTAHSAPLLGPGRPPLRVEEGLIEVGWSPEAEADDAEIASVPTPATVAAAGPAVDPWTDWARGDDPDELGEAEDAQRDLPGVRPEPGREFAPNVPHFGRRPAVEDLGS